MNAKSTRDRITTRRMEGTLVFLLQTLATIHAAEPMVFTANPANGHRYGLTDGRYRGLDKGGRIGAEPTVLDAEALAVSLGGHLVTINDAEEQAWLLATFGTVDPNDHDNLTENLWIGLNDLQVEGSFAWFSGEPVTYLNWASNEPSNDHGEDVVALDHPSVGALGNWNDVGSEMLGERSTAWRAIVELAAPTLDFGDAPPGYPVTLAEDGARHIFGGPEWRLGGGWDAEWDGDHSAGADGDDTQGAKPDDEDGVVFASTRGTITVDVTAGTAGRLDAWIDFTRDKDWDDLDEQVATSLELAAGTTRLSLPVPGYVTQAGPFVSRWRFSENGGLSYKGAGGKGEVEDHVIPWEPETDPCTGLAESSVRLSIRRDLTGVALLGWSTVAGASYRLEWTANPVSGLWTPMVTLRGTGTDVSLPAPTGETARYYRVAAACHPVRLGSWGQRIWSSNITSAWQDDTANYVAALWATGQNFCVYDVDHEACDGNLPNWENFKALLEEVKGTDFHVFAAVDVPHLTAFTRWHVPSGLCTWTNCTCTFDTTTWDYGAFYACQTNCLQYWLDAWINAAATLSQLSLDYPNLVGLVLNDIDSYVESADFPACIYGDRLTRDQVREIADAAHRYNPKFGLWPTCYYTFASIIGNGCILGANSGVALIRDEEMSVTWEFLLTAPTPSAQFSFLHFDRVEEVDRGLNLSKEAYVNGTQVYSAAMAANQSHELFATNITSLLLSAGTNQITLKLRATGDENSCSTKFWYIWDPRVQVPRDGGWATIPFLSTNFFTNALHLDYTNSVGCATGVTGTNLISNTQFRSPPSLGCSTLPNDPVNGYMSGRLVAAPTDRFSIRDLVAGVVAPYYLTSTNRSATPTYDAVKFGRMLDAATSALGGAKLMALQLGQVQSTNLDFDLVGLSEQLHLAAAKADYTALWEMPLGLYGLNRIDPTLSLGLFAPRTSNDPSYNFLAYWPPQKAVRGWYQSWRSTSSLSGRNLKVTVHCDESPANESRVKVYLDNGTAGIDWLVNTNVGSLTTETLSITNLNSTLVLAAEIDLSWTWSTSVYFKVEDVDDATADLGPTTVNWTYETGVSPDTQRTYDVERRIFLDLAK